jgi:hypothetical protein
MPDGDYYSVLGVAPEVSGSEIQAAHERLKQQLADGQLPQSQEAAIEQAFQTLGDPIRRLRYDAQLSAPAPPRFQMPEVNLPGRRLRVSLPTLRGRHLPVLPQVDPIIGGAVALAIAVALVVVVLFVVRGRGTPSAPAESVANLVPAATASATSAAGTSGTGVAGTPRSILGSPVAGQPAGVAPAPQAPNAGPGSLAPVGTGQTGIGATNLPPSLLPIGSAGSPLTPNAPPPGILTSGEPPFLTSSALVDMLRAVIAASAVRNAPPPGAAPPAAAATPGAVPITGLPSLPPVVTGAVGPVLGGPPPSGAPSSASGPDATGAFAGPNLATPPPATPRPVPNHITVPTGPITAAGAGQGTARSSGTGTANRIGGTAATPTH